MVCMGNICRSPTAQAVLRRKLEGVGLGGEVTVDSGGTHAWHKDEPPDMRAIRHAGWRGYDLSASRARRVSDDFERHDLILGMDGENLAALHDRCPEVHRGKLALLMVYAVRHRDQLVVPDPYYGGPNGFERVLDLIEDACDGLLAHLWVGRHSQTHSQQGLQVDKTSPGRI
jgi:protein-tyrosine phosphatase